MKKEVNNIQPKIELVACAKDEAAYLPEWIFFHLKIGFSKIKIYINNTSDDSIRILDKIIMKHPQVSYVIADELIENPPEHYASLTNDDFYKSNKTQAVVYTDALANNNADCDYIAFLDIDEFFYPFKPLNEIFHTPDSKTLAIQFKWLLLSGDKKEFCSLAQCAKGYMDSHFKSVVPRTDNQFKAEDPHCFSHDGDIGQASDAAVVLHRVLRSKNEYLYLLAKSTSDSKSKLANGFKKNRRGWTDRGEKLSNFQVFFDDHYEKQLDSFINECGLKQDLAVAKENIIEKSALIKENITVIYQQNLDLTRSLAGLNINHISFIKTMSMFLFWRLVNFVSPRLVLSHDTIKKALLSKIHFLKK